MNRAAHPIGIVSEYREFPPPSPLKQHFLCFWTQRISGSHGEYSHRVLPDGCIDVVFINDEAPVFVGPWTAPFVARLAGGTMIVGARWRPGCATSFLGVPAPLLLNQSVPLRAVWGNATNLDFSRVTDQRDLASRRSALGNALLGRLARSASVDRVVSASIEWLAQNPHGRMEQLSQWIGLSRRHLQRRFVAAVGYGPKTFQSVLRFQRLLNLANGKDEQQTLAELSVNAGYADQAHMTREVRRFSGSVPTALLQSAECTLRMSEFFRLSGD
jgi:AraC-like DNA-binding protein